MDPDPDSLFLFLALTFNWFTAIKITALIVLLICSALISGTEVAFFSLSQTELDEIIEKEKEKKHCCKIIRKA